MTKSDVFDIVLVVFGLLCLFHGVVVVSTEFFMGLIQSTESFTIIRNPWATGLHAVLLFAFAYLFLIAKASQQREKNDSSGAHKKLKHKLGDALSVQEQCRRTPSPS